MHVRLVEDDALVASAVLAAGSRLHGFTVEHAELARLADAELATSQFDVAILDLGLPDEDGMSLLARWCDRGLQEDPAGTDPVCDLAEAVREAIRDAKAATAGRGESRWSTRARA